MSTLLCVQVFLENELKKSSDPLENKKIEIQLKDTQDLGHMIQRIRKRKGWTQLLLSEKARIPQPMLSMIESGKRIPEAQTLLHLCHVLSIDLLARER